MFGEVRQVAVDEDGQIFVQTWEKTEDGEGFIYDIFGLDQKFYLFPVFL